MAYNLLADGIVQVGRALATLEGKGVKAWAKEHGLERYFGSSVKGEATIDWDSDKAREAFLEGIVADADRVLKLARPAQAGESQRRVPLQPHGFPEAAPLARVSPLTTMHPSMGISARFLVVCRS